MKDGWCFNVLDLQKHQRFMYLFNYKLSPQSLFQEDRYDPISLVICLAEADSPGRRDGFWGHGLLQLSTNPNSF